MNHISNIFSRSIVDCSTVTSERVSPAHFLKWPSGTEKAFLTRCMALELKLVDRSPTEPGSGPPHFPAAAAAKKGRQHSRGPHCLQSWGPRPHRASPGDFGSYTGTWCKVVPLDHRAGSKSEMEHDPRGLPGWWDMYEGTPPHSPPDTGAPRAGQGKLHARPGVKCWL